MRRMCLLAGLATLGAGLAVEAEPLVVITDRAAGRCLQYAPAFSFDGQHVAWIEQREPNGDSYVQVMEAGGSRKKTRRVPEEGQGEAFCWAPDGDVLAHVDACWPTRDGTAKLSTFDLDLHMEAEMRLDAVAAHHPIWTASGIQLVLVQGQMGEAEACYLARVAPETGKVEFLTGPIDNERLRSPSSDTAFAWSPEGNAAVLLGGWGAPFLQVWEDGLPALAPGNGFAELNLRPLDTPCLAVGPEGKEIFFGAVRRRERGSTAVWRYRPDEADAKPVLGFRAGNEWPICLAVSPTGDRLAVISARVQGGDWNRAVAVLHVARLTEEREWGEREIPVEEGFLKPGGWPRRHPTISWSPDGEHVAYSIGGQVRVASVGTPTVACIQHLKQTGLAFLMFASDWDEALPGPEHVAFYKQHDYDGSFRAVEGVDWWVPIIYPYVRDRSVMRCPLMAEGQRTGYVYPEHLWGKNVGDIENPSKTILLMDSAPRHDGCRVVGFADGHVKACAEEEVQKLLDQQ